MQKVEIKRTDYRYRKVVKGRPYLYFRMPKEFGGKLFPLPIDEASVEFKRQYDACAEKLRRMQIDAGPPEPPKPRPEKVAKAKTGTIGQAIGIYRNSQAFKKKKKATHEVYIPLLEKMKAKIGNELLREMTRKAAQRFVNGIFEEDGRASMADLYLTLISNIWIAVREDEAFGISDLPNPTIEIERKHSTSDSVPHLIWPEDIQEKFDATAPENLRLARRLLHFTTQRGGDAIKIKWSHYDGKGIHVWPEKTTKKGVIAEPNYHLLPDELIQELEAAKKIAAAADFKSEYILVNKWGCSWTRARSLSIAIKAHLVRIGVRKKRQKKGFTMHGLRHTGACEISLLPGVGVKGIKSQTGHKTDRLALYYAEQAEKRRANEMMIAAWNEERARKTQEKLRHLRAGISVVK